MYTPDHYKNENLEEVKKFIAKNAFGILVNQTNGRPWATHIPLELDVDPQGKDILVGHIAKANPQWQYFKEDEEVLAIFNGPHSYISSSWYKDEEVPTWNYIAVHVYGKIKILDKAAVMESLRKLVDKYEKSSEQPVSIEKLSEATMKQIVGVVGFQIDITEIQATYKLSQTRPEDHSQIIDQLEKTNNHGSKDVAHCMKHLKK
ncbi:FMN-binding negative transcriptional regulator [Arenibacter aquaticus]|uniref:FMN-binding negative transcriptional regulator n=1 Tax=Arenibacter aquaticus TaxID=2489054 RepID=A0A3S0C6E5_9FLAO|nr:FMN-binding negative transcriptional regulator [Arenibacter aquaticus]RTE53094.1 FMN-binding negative transcriptional regulator [Arenibacter aquaticus]